jgi:N-acetylneuraminate synthase
MITTLSRRFKVPVGLSDHTMGTIVSSTAVALGACVIEKHFTLSRADGGPDALFSLEPGELMDLVANCHTAWEALGHSDFTRSPSEIENSMFRRSLYVVEDVAVGEIFTRRNVRSIRPGFGMEPKYMPEILGKTALQPLKRGTSLQPNYIKEK